VPQERTEHRARIAANQEPQRRTDRLPDPAHGYGLPGAGASNLRSCKLMQ
jgi:hypothetical protein